MIAKVVHIKKLEKNSLDDVHYWLEKKIEERISVVEELRRDYWGKDYATKSGFPGFFKIIKHT